MARGITTGSNPHIARELARELAMARNTSRKEASPGRETCQLGRSRERKAVEV